MRSSFQLKGSGLGIIFEHDLSDEQKQQLERSSQGSHYLEGPAGSGKTTVGIFSVLQAVKIGAAAESILVLVPQRRLGRPYLDRIYRADALAGTPEVVTVAGLARRTVELFWPVIAEQAGFQRPTEPPRFLTLETAQYHMARVVGPYLDEGYFESLSLDRYRLYRQILDNLNKAAVVGFPTSEIGDRLSEAWVGPGEQTRIYKQAEYIAQRFRSACLEDNLVDFSLQYELFFDYVEPTPEFQRYFAARYQHIVADNVEEETPQGHDFIARWLPTFKTALIIADQDGGYSRFLGADPDHLWRLRDACDQSGVLKDSFVMSRSIKNFSELLRESIYTKRPDSFESIKDAIAVKSSKYLPDLLTWMVAEVEALLKAGTPASKIAIVSPFVSDALRFVLTDRMEDVGIPWISHRPSRAIADEAYNRSLLTLAAIAHPQWEISPSREIVSQSLMTVIEGLDLIRASLLANTLYRFSEDIGQLETFGQLRPEMQERIGFQLGEKYEYLREWIQKNLDAPGAHLDQFISRLFGEVLSQPGYGFHHRMDAGRAAEAMINSVRKFRSVVDSSGRSKVEIGREYYELINEGLLAAQYLATEQPTDQEAVFIAPAFTYLTMDQRSEVQFWLDIGNPAWAERLYQPLTHPYVLSRSWERGQKWTDDNEWGVRRQILSTLTTGLARRCGVKIYLCHSSYGEQGLEQQSILLSAIQRLLADDLYLKVSGDV